MCVENRKFSLPWQQGSVWVKSVEHSLIGRPRKPYYRAKNDKSISYTSGVMANFLLKFRNFRYRGNRGWCDTNFVCTVKFADPENPMFCARIGDIISSTSKVIANFVITFFPIFLLMLLDYKWLFDVMIRALHHYSANYVALIMSLYWFK